MSTFPAKKMNKYLSIIHIYKNNINLLKDQLGRRKNKKYTNDANDQSFKAIEKFQSHKKLNNSSRHNRKCVMTYVMINFKLNCTDSNYYINSEKKK